jgi:predicted outer membrane repeat protein
LQGDGAGMTVAVADCAFIGNVCRGNGGAIGVGDGYAARIMASNFQTNVAARRPGGGDSRGGAVFVASPASPSSLAMVDCVLDGNEAAGPGGAIAVDDASVELIGTEVLNSRSAVDGQTPWSAGAGLHMRRTEAHVEPITLVVTGCLFEDNHGNLTVDITSGDGGGILVRGYPDGRMVDVTVTETDFVDNYNAQGAGLYVGRFATGTVSYCRFLRNRGHVQAGGAAKGGSDIANTGETAVFVYCEFTGNRAGLDLEDNVTGDFNRGGAVLVRHYPRAEFYNCSFSDNLVVSNGTALGDGLSHASEGGEFDSDAERCALYNCVFYGPEGNDYQIRANPDGFSAVDHCAYEPGQFFSAGVEPEATIWLDGSPFVADDDPHLVEGSPCIDAAADLGFDRDLDGHVVPQGDGPDVGAYEWPGVSDVHATPGAGAAPRVYPNPFNPRTSIVFTLAREGRIALAVFDLRGRRIATLRDGPAAAGTHRVVWDGTDDAGLAVAAGIYYARLAHAGRHHTAKMTLVR